MSIAFDISTLMHSVAKSFSVWIMVRECYKFVGSLCCCTLCRFVVAEILWYQFQMHAGDDAVSSENKKRRRWLLVGSRTSHCLGVRELWLMSPYILHSFITRWVTTPEPPLMLCSFDTTRRFDENAYSLNLLFIRHIAKHRFERTVPRAEQYLVPVVWYANEVPVRGLYYWSLPRTSLGPSYILELCSYLYDCRTCHMSSLAQRKRRGGFTQLDDHES